MSGKETKEDISNPKNDSKTTISESTAAIASPTAPPTHKIGSKRKRARQSSRSAMMRLMSEWKSLQEEEPEGISAAPARADDLFFWKGCILGPPETPWEGGVLPLLIRFPSDYPNTPPEVLFSSEVYHPNVYRGGAICLDILKEKWSPVYTISTILVSLQSLLTDPNPASPANPDAANVWKSDKKAYARKVRQCVQRISATQADGIVHDP